MLFSLEKRKIRWKLIYVHKYLGEGCTEDGVRLFSVVPSDRIRDNRHKLKHSRFSLNIGKHFLYCEGGQAHVAQGVCRVFLFGDFKSHLDLVLDYWL